MGKLEVYNIGNRMDTTNSEVKQHEIAELIENGNPLALDFSECTYVSSAGLRVILYAYKKCMIKNIDFFIAGLLPPVEELLKITGFNRFLRCYPSIKDIPNTIS